MDKMADFDGQVPTRHKGTVGRMYYTFSREHDFSEVTNGNDNMGPIPILMQI